MNPIEIVGLAATILVLISFLMKKILWIRLINIVGAIGFVVYGVIIGALSTWLLNALLIVIHVVYLSLDFFKNRKKQQSQIETAVNTTEIKE